MDSSHTYKVFDERKVKNTSWSLHQINYSVEQERHGNVKYKKYGGGKVDNLYFVFTIFSRIVCFASNQNFLVAQSWNFEYPLFELCLTLYIYKNCNTVYGSDTHLALNPSTEKYGMNSASTANIDYNFNYNF